MITSIINSSCSKTSGKGNTGVMPVYVVFVTVAVLVYHLIAEGEFSSILTLSAIFQCLALSILGLQALNDAKGISVKSLQLDALALACRLSSTTWLEGYLPADQTGDYLYQVFDAVSLAMVLWLLCHMMKSRSYDADEDTLPMCPLALGCLGL